MNPSTICSERITYIPGELYTEVSPDWEVSPQGTGDFTEGCASCTSGTVDAVCFSLLTQVIK